MFLSDWAIAESFVLRLNKVFPREYTVAPSYLKGKGGGQGEGQGESRTKVGRERVERG
jgi:hypothetical protein